LEQRFGAIGTREKHCCWVEAARDKRRMTTGIHLAEMLVYRETIAGRRQLPTHDVAVVARRPVLIQARIG